MKKALSVIVAAVMACSLAACGGSTAATTAAPAATTAAAAETTAAAAATTAAAAETQAAESGDKLVLSVAYTTSDDAPEGAYALEFKRAVEELSGGKIEAQLYPAGQMGSDREMMESVQFGSVSIAFTGLTQFSNFVTDLSYLDAPFLLQTRDQVYKLFDSEQFSTVLTKDMEEAGFHYLGAFLLGFRELTTNRDINTVADMKGMKIRVIESPTPLAIWNALGCNPTPLAFAEVYTALQQGTVDAQENPITNIYDKKFYEQQKYVVLTNHQVHPDFVGMNIDLWDSLSDELKGYITEASESAVKAANNYAETFESKQIDDMNAKGTQVLTPSDDLLKEMYDATQSVRDDLAAQYPEMAEAVTAGLQ